MSKRKGVSADEKRTRLLELFYEKKEFFQLKELEKIAPKEKGIVAQSVQGVLQGLVDEGLVDTDKIGISTYFWAFQSKTRNAKKIKLETIITDLESSKIKLQSLQEKLLHEKAGRADEKEHSEAIQKLNELQLLKESLVKDLEKYSNCDPDYLNKLKQNNHVIKEAVNRWTENIFVMKSWCKNKASMESDAINKYFGIPEDLDYIDI